LFKCNPFGDSFWVKVEFVKIDLMGMPGQPESPAL
jgi:hypothetical protein